MLNDSLKSELIVRDCGTSGYREMLDLQLELLERRIADEVPNTVLIVEHEPVVTMGARKSENRLLLGDEEFGRRGIVLEAVRRGGGTTAHNPGQIVLYPVVKLKSLGLSVSDYVRSLEQIGIDMLAEFGLECGRKKGAPGLWVGERKIGSVGVKVQKWVTYHGMAININNDLGIFDTIVPCGLAGVEMTSLVKEVGGEIDMKRVRKVLAGVCVEHWSDKELVRYEE
ncbi:Octanoyltransferase [Anaerohalosphaera lusitana]|uniref:Octanoyltransferase n=1 Tax=Anaerohalosphaera lusitana TaxID=1936003 RepID=A0A1U9NKR8_9BACT|nr:lipoyl(octanoyl) transferase LipB [Anaerohalosphaera lusitana]AQT68397.1 Octanoyltransferase [Anaerohalosphaera lusitana]